MVNNGGRIRAQRDKAQWGRRPPFIGAPESNRYAHSPHRAVVPLDITVLPLGVAVLLLRVAVLLLASGTKKIHPCLLPMDLGRVFGLEQYYRCSSRCSTALER